MKRQFVIQTIVAVLFMSQVFSKADTPGSQEREWKGRVEKEKGIEVIKNPAEPVFEEAVLHFDEDLSLGEKEEYRFSRISGIAVDKEERIYVLDYTEAQVKVFDKNGLFLWNIGKKGQGPGELASPFSISIAPDDEVAIQDLNNRKILYFSLEGQFIKSISTAEWVIVGMKTDTKGHVVTVVSNMHPDKQVIELKKFDLELNSLVSFRSISLPRRSPPFNPFGPDISWALTDSDHVICGYPENYILDVYDPEGNSIRKIHKEAKPIKISQGEIEEAKKRLPGPMKLDIPKYHSAYRDFTVDEEGRIFVRTWEKEESASAYYFDIFDPAGKYIVKIPLTFNPAVWKNGKVYAIEENESGFQVVKRYKVIWD